MNCRRVPGYLEYSINGFAFPRLLHYVIYPIVLIPLMAGIPTFLVFLLLNSTTTWIRPPIGGPILIVVLALFYAPIFWFVYLWPLSSRLVLHEHGIRGKWPLKRFAVRFEDIDHIRIGKKLGAVETTLLGAASYVKPMVVASRVVQMENALSLFLRNGRTIWLGYILTRFNVDDVSRLLMLAEAKVPIRHVEEKDPS
jgi:hypothetical protein